MYEELVKRLRDQDNCNVLDDVDEAADAIEALEKQLAETEATADHEHCRYIEILGERDGMEARCQIISAERDKYKASLDQIENIAVGFMESGPCESEALSGLWLVNRVISLALAPLEENRDGT